MTVIDTNDNVSTHIASLKSRGVTAIGRYYSSDANKRLTKQESIAISKAGIRIFVVFEDDGDPELTTENGIHHAQIAMAQAKNVGQPDGSAIYFALEHLPNGYTKKDLKSIKSYVGGIKQVLADKYKVGIYSDGVVCDCLLSKGICDYTWLSASLGFEGSIQFRDSGKWSIFQQVPLDQDWDGLSVDVNNTQGDFGSFILSINTTTLALSDSVNTTSIITDADVASRQTASGGTFASRLVAIATEQWEYFGKQTYDIDGHKYHAGHTEGEDGWYQRVGEYWLDGTNTHGIDGRDHDSPWSAAFISWVMKKAGAGVQFRYSTQHSVYIFQGIRDFLNKRDAAGYWTERLNAAKPAVGDLVCWARQPGIDYDNQNSGDYKGHSDIVVEVAQDRIWIIGGNVGDSVTRRPLALDTQGFLPPTVQNGETLFAIMKCRIS